MEPPWQVHLDMLSVLGFVGCCAAPWRAVPPVGAKVQLDLCLQLCCAECTGSCLFTEVKQCQTCWVVGCVTTTWKWRVLQAPIPHHDCGLYQYIGSIWNRNGEQAAFVCWIAALPWFCNIWLQEQEPCHPIELHEFCSLNGSQHWCCCIWK